MSIASWRGVKLLVALTAMLVLLSSCGNRVPYEQLKADATGVEGVQEPGAAGAVEGTTRSQQEAGSIALPTGAADGPEVGEGGAPAAAGAATSSTAGAAGGNDKTSANAANGTQGSVGTRASCAGSLAPIKIGSIGLNSGVIGAIVGPGVKALQVWSQWVNAQGGIACHPVELFVADDTGDPATHITLVQSFVEQKGVVAFVFMTDPFAGQASIKYMNEKRIPVFGSEGASDWFNTNPTYFPQMTSGGPYVESVIAMAGALAAKGSKLATLTCIEGELCSSVYAIADKLATKYGMTLVYRGQVSLTEPNFTASCLAAKNAGAQIVFIGLDGASTQRISRSCASVGYYPQLVTPAVGVTPAMSASPDLAGLRVALPVVPWFLPGNPALKDYIDAVAKYAPGLAPSAVGVQAWVAGQVFGAAASKVGARPTSADILAGAFTIRNNNFGGLTSRLTYKTNAASHEQPMCWWAAEFNGPQTTSPNGGKLTCGDAEPVS